MPIQQTVVPDSMIISAINIDLQTDIHQAYQCDSMALEAFKGLKHGSHPFLF